MERSVRREQIKKVGEGNQFIALSFFLKTLAGARGARRMKLKGVKHFLTIQGHCPSSVSSGKRKF